jgi:hypothetical protein
VKRYINVIIWSILIVILSLLPKSSLDVNHVKLFKGADKIVHFILYAVLMFLWLRPRILVNESKNTNSLIVIGCIYSISLGIILEILQNYLEIGRSFDTFDIVANILGVVFIIFILNNKKF